MRKFVNSVQKAYVFENILPLYRLNLIKDFSWWSMEALLVIDNITNWKNKNNGYKTGRNISLEL